MKFFWLFSIFLLLSLGSFSLFTLADNPGSDAFTGGIVPLSSTIETGTELCCGP